MSTYDKDIEAYWAERMPTGVKKLFDKAINDLYSGPSYYDVRDQMRIVFGNELAAYL